MTHRALLYLITGDESLVPRIVEMILASKPEYNVGGGLVLTALWYDWIYNEPVSHNVYLHGDTASGQPVLPTLFTYLAAWGPADDPGTVRDLQALWERLRLQASPAILENDGFVEGAADLRVTHRNLNDGTVEGLAHVTRPVFAVQYHPEAAPGPHDSRYLFRQFMESMSANSAVPTG